MMSNVGDSSFYRRVKMLVCGGALLITPACRFGFEVLDSAAPPEESEVEETLQQEVLGGAPPKPATGGSSGGSMQAPTGGTASTPSLGGMGGMGGAPAPPCTIGPFGDPEVLTGFELSTGLFGPAIDSENETLYFSATDGPSEDIYKATRSDRGTSFEAAELAPLVNSDSADGTPFVSANGLRLYMFSERDGTSGGRDLMVASRAAIDEDFGVPEWLPVINSPGTDHLPTLTADELVLIFASTRDGGSGGSDLWMTDRESLTDDFAEPVHLASLNGAGREAGPALSADGLTLYFVSERDGSEGNDIYVTSRVDRESDFEEPMRVDLVSTPGSDLDAALSVDGRELFYSTNDSGSRELYRIFKACE